MIYVDRAPHRRHGASYRGAPRALRGGYRPGGSL